MRSRMSAPSISVETDASRHWLRREMNQAIDDRLSRLDAPSLTAAEVGGSAHSGRGWRTYDVLDYPEFDLCAPKDVGMFDVVICEQVLEHVIDPCRAARTLHDLCAPGGLVIVSTPFLVRIHELPEYGLRDYWRFTPRGLALLIQRSGLVVETLDSWGNRSCLAANLDHWATYRPWRSLRDEPELPLQVWVSARRQTE